MSDSKLVRNFFGGMLMAIGGLIAGLCGLCTGTYEIMFLYGFVSDGRFLCLYEYFAVFIPLLFGIVPIGLGLVLFVVGRGLWTDGPENATPVIRPFDE